jgi:rRNA maturation endonuclease Nob1
MAGDRDSPGALNEYHEYRKKLKHFYVCKKCGHGFDRNEPVDKCIFCNGEVKEVERDDVLTGKPVTTFVCPNCYKKFIAEKAEKCPKCGSRFLHSYKTARVSTKILLSTRKDQIKEKLKKRLLRKVLKKSD